jgi:hypothetical protein
VSVILVVALANLGIGLIIGGAVGWAFTVFRLARRVWDSLERIPDLEQRIGLLEDADPPHLPVRASPPNGSPARLPATRGTPPNSTRRNTP